MRTRILAVLKRLVGYSAMVNYSGYYRHDADKRKGY